MRCREIIFGYGDLKVKLFYAAGCLETYLGLNYTEKASVKSDGVEADEVFSKLVAKLAPDVCYSLTDFTRALAKDDMFVPHGELINSFTINGILTFSLTTINCFYFFLLFWLILFLIVFNYIY